MVTCSSNGDGATLVAGDGLGAWRLWGDLSREINPMTASLSESTGLSPAPTSAAEESSLGLDYEDLSHLTS